MGQAPRCRQTNDELSVNIQHGDCSDLLNCLDYLAVVARKALREKARDGQAYK